ncbi:MAG: hypothetical protein NVS2B7_40020 [Herpetosiphon sp.]
MISQQAIWTGQVDFVDHRGIEWDRVIRTRFVACQRFHYEYPGPIHQLKHHLVVAPCGRYGNQWLRGEQCVVTPGPVATTQRFDRFGNCVWDFEIPQVERTIAFEVMTTVERRARRGASPLVGAEMADLFRQPTRLTTSDDHIRSVACELAARSKSQSDLAEKIDDWVAGAIRYGSGTGVCTTAAQALAHGQGLCQDYAHIMIAACRAVNLPARYVSGHMPGEGGSHAWVEVLLPNRTGSRLHAIAFDPTNRRRPNLGYTTVAHGRDYSDVAPTSGSYSAPYTGQLSFSKRAGLTLLEFADGEKLTSECV